MFREDLHGDVGHPSLNGSAMPNLETIRLATLADVPIWIEKAKAKYPGRDVEKATRWAEWCVQNPNRLVLVGRNCAGIAQVDQYYGFECKAKLDMLFGDPSWETFRMVRMMVRWAREKGATGTFRLDADTGADFAPFAARLGGRPVTVTRYEIPLE